MRRFVLPAILCLVSAAGGAAFVQAQQKKVPSVTTDDYAEIQRLLYANHTGYDFAMRDNGDLWTSTFTPDAVLDNPPSLLTGHEEIRAYATVPANKAPNRKFRHWTSTFHVTPNAEGAILSAFYLVISDSDGRTPMTIGPTGRYESQVVRTKAGWKIKRHVVRSEGSAVARTEAPRSQQPAPQP